MCALQTTLDGFLGNRVMLEQPKTGHRAGTDAVFLAACANPPQGARVLDLGAGVGVAGICLKHRRPDVHLVLAEIDAEMAELARSNLARNAMTGEVIVCDITERPAALAETGLKPDSFDMVLTNPPFYQSGRVTASGDVRRARAHVARDDLLALWLRRAGSLLQARGEMILIHRPQALDALLAAMPAGFGDIRLLPLHGRPQTCAERLILAARKGRRTPLSLLPGLFLNESDGRPSRVQGLVSREGAGYDLDRRLFTAHMAETHQSREPSP